MRLIMYFSKSLNVFLSVFKIAAQLLDPIPVCFLTHVESYIAYVKVNLHNSFDFSGAYKIKHYSSTRN